MEQPSFHMGKSGLVVQPDNLRDFPRRGNIDGCAHHLRGAAAVKHDAAVFVRCVAILNGQALHDCGPESRGRDCLIDYEQVHSVVGEVSYHCGTSCGRIVRAFTLVVELGTPTAVTKEQVDTALKPGAVAHKRAAGVYDVGGKAQHTICTEDRTFSDTVREAVCYDALDHLNFRIVQDTTLTLSILVSQVHNVLVSVNGKPAGVDTVLARLRKRFHHFRLIMLPGEAHNLDVARPSADFIQGDGFAADCVGILGTGVTFSHF